MTIITLPFMSYLWFDHPYDHVLPNAPASVAATVTSCSLGVLTYNWYATLSQYPNVFISESCIPVLAAVVSAPILKLSTVLGLVNADLLQHFPYFCHKTFSGKWASILKQKQWSFTWPPHCHVWENCHEWTEGSNCPTNYNCHPFPNKCFWLLMLTVMNDDVFYHPLVYPHT